MALQRKGGRGNRSALDVVMHMREGGTSEQGIRRELRQQGYKAPRIHQLLKATMAGKRQGGSFRERPGASRERSRYPLSTPSRASFRGRILEPRSGEKARKRAISERARFSSERHSVLKLTFTKWPDHWA